MRGVLNFFLAALLSLQLIIGRNWGAAARRFVIGAGRVETLAREFAK